MTANGNTEASGKPKQQPAPGGSEPRANEQGDKDRAERLRRIEEERRERESQSLRGLHKVR
jgi:hypothetical protein